MADLSSIGISGLITTKTALATVSHNIVNADTEGYSRQRVDATAVDPVRFGSSYVGSGVQVNGISRSSNQYVVDQLRRDTQNYNSYDAYYSFAVRVDSLLGDEATALTPSLQSYFNSLQDLSNDPTSVPVRQVLLSEGRSLSNRFNTVFDQVNQQNEALNNDLAAVCSQISEIAAGIADINRAVKVAASARPGQLPNDLLDRRDAALRELSELVGISVITNKDNTVNVALGTGQTLVVDDSTFRLRAVNQNSGLSRNDILLGTENAPLSEMVTITDKLTGGRLGGLLNVRNELIDPVFNEIGRLALGVADRVNEQHRLGMDVKSNLGGDFFTAINNSALESARVAASVTNTGNAELSCTIDDTSKLKATNYLLRYDGTQYSLIDTAESQTVATFVPPPAPGAFPITAEGFTFNMLSGTPQAGDTYLVTPCRLGAQEIGMKISSTEQIAAALPVRTTTALSNTGSGYVEEVTMTNTDDPITGSAFVTARAVPPVRELVPPYRVVFTSETSYDVFDISAVPATLAGSGIYTQNQGNNLLAQAGITNKGYDVVLNGFPKTGDTFNIEYNGGGIADNRNAKLLAGLRTEKTVGDSTASFSEAYSQVVSGVGTRTRDARVGQEASQSILRQTEAQRDSISAVNLDEEAADLIKFQQAYEATARVIQVTGKLFDALISSV